MSSARGRLARWLRRYLTTCGVAANLAGAALLVGVLVLGPRGTYEQVRDAGDTLRVTALEWHGALLAWSAQRTRRELDLQATALAEPFGAPADAAVGGSAAAARVLRVGPGEDLATPGAASRVARDGDFIEIAAGDYPGESVRWRADDLVVRGVGGFAHVDVDGTRLVEEKAAWLVQGDRMRIEQVTFSGARSRDRNGAGIRAEGSGLHVRRCRFLDNETGILSNPVPGGRIVVEYSEFAGNGHPDGQAHQIYISDSAEFVLRGSYLHGTVIGSAVKSRSRSNVIEYNRIVDGANGRSNYTIDLSEGGQAVIVGNELEQGPYSGNGRLIAFGPEGARGGDTLHVVHNTLVSDRVAGRFVWNNTTGLAHLYNNLMVGGRRAIEGAALLVGNVFASDAWPGPRGAELGGVAGSNHNQRVSAAAAGIVSRAALDYRLQASSPAVNAAIALDEHAAGRLSPRYEYRHPAATHARDMRSGADAGAHELAE